ncbi:MAG: hypothetical protein R6X05_04115 [Desulfobacterales bacterium]
MSKKLSVWMRVLAVAAGLLAAATLPAAAKLGQIAVPPALAPWVPWVLHGLEAEGCPPAFDGARRHCAWPGPLEIEVLATEGRFRQEWVLFAEDWLPLPGDPTRWPQAVAVNGRPLPVMARAGGPAVLVAAGTHTVTGRFQWREHPETLRIPPAVGLVRLAVAGRPVALPLVDGEGRLWLAREADRPDREDQLGVTLLRRLKDDIPMRLTTLLKLNVSGRSREVALAGLLPPQTVPMAISSPLPARFREDGRLTVQVRPGKWELRLEARFQGPLSAVGPLAGTHGREIWAFEAQPNLRLVDLSGASGIDPGQTELPAEWQRLPAFVIDPGSVLSITETRRGDPEPAPDRLSLERTWWLDFDGGGLTAEDRITGSMRRQWYLAMNPPAALGRVTVDGEDRLITAQGPGQKPGVSLRRGQLGLTAVSRLEAPAGRLAAVGWDHGFQSVRATLNLPPGWRLLGAGGVDQITGTWLQRWTLLDFFLVLIVALSFLKLRGWGWGGLALATMALIYHEPGAPRLVWLNLLAALALLKVMPPGWGSRLVGAWLLAAALVLVVLVVPFMVSQVRGGLYPQLADHDGPAANRVRMMDAVDFSSRVEKSGETPRAGKQLATTAEKTPLPGVPQQSTAVDDPQALVQTGPGLPTWQWRTFALQWNGPVTASQEIRLWLVPPGANLALAFLRVFCLAGLCIALFDRRFWQQRLNFQKWARSMAAGLLLGVALPAAVVRAEAHPSGFPPAPLLEELKTRLLQKPDCLPFCATLERLDLTARDGHLRLELSMHAGCDAAVPLPATAASWLPQTVLVDEKPAAGIIRGDQGNLWTLVKEGVQRVVLTGPVGSRDSIQLPLPLPPRAVSFDLDGWSVRGVGKDGRVENGLQLVREGPPTATAAAEAERFLPPFLHVTRELRLGLSWQVLTTVERLTAPDFPVSLSLPLISGEAVVTPGIPVENGTAQIILPAGSRRLAFSADLPVADEIRLKAPDGVPWSETWVLDAGPVWDCRLAGIAVVHHQDSDGQWRPKWRPWPGEEVLISVSRPQPVAGRQVTVDAVRLEWTPGNRLDRSQLVLHVRSSRGGQHALQLPPAAELQQVSIDGQSLPLTAAHGKLIVPLRPGAQTVTAAWHQEGGMRLLQRSPAVAIGDAAVNAAVTIRLPQNRWLLWAGGPRLGPAVLFWSYLVVAVLMAIGLGRFRLTPLKTRDWILLILGLTQVPVPVALTVVGWLMALGLRRKFPPPDNWAVFNGLQLGVAGWTVLALGGLYLAIQNGLLGIPEMQVGGNFSSLFELNWYQDRIGAQMPEPWVLSLPLWVYRVLMLAWSLWLAFGLLKWLRWGWDCWNAGGWWRKRVLRNPATPAANPE